MKKDIFYPKQFVVSLILVFTMVFFAQMAHAADAIIVVRDAFAKATPKGARTAAIYMNIKNNGAEPDRLTSITTELADKAQIHTMTMQGDVMQMRALPGDLIIPPHSSVSLSPMASHIMLIGLKQPLIAGGNFTLVLHFAKCGEMDINVIVKPIAASENMNEDTQNHLPQ